MQVAAAGMRIACNTTPAGISDYSHICALLDSPNEPTAVGSGSAVGDDQAFAGSALA